MKQSARLTINALAASAGATWRLLRENKHLRVEFSAGARSVTLTFANSPSDRRALANLAADLRRAFRRWLLSTVHVAA